MESGESLPVCLHKAGWKGTTRWDGGMDGPEMLFQIAPKSFSRSPHHILHLSPTDLSDGGPTKDSSSGLSILCHQIMSMIYNFTNVVFTPTWRQISSMQIKSEHNYESSSLLESPRDSDDSYSLAERGI